MIFSSLIFIFLFLPVVMMSYFLVRKEFQNTLLIVASLFFYAWGEKELVLLMMVSMFGNYLFGILIDKTRQKNRAKYILILSVVFNIGLLGVFKYANFVVDNINAFLKIFSLDGIRLDPVHLPIGISFFTFQAMSYVIDVYRGVTPVQRKPANVALYISLFPQLIAGPIVRYHDIASQLHQRKIDISTFRTGVERFIAGLGKKVLIANTMGAAADKIFAIPTQDLTFGLSWLGIVTYTLQIYFDFSGYSDMAIGLGRLFGFQFLENFNFPYISKSIIEFWKRWHISLSNWLRDYLFLPIAYATMRRIPGSHLYKIKVETWGYAVGMVGTMFLGGLWHGASWNFVAWGLLHGTFSVLERLYLGKRLQRAWTPVRHMYALTVIMLGWVFFRSDSFAYAFDFLASLAGFGRGNGSRYFLEMYLDNKTLLILILGIIFSTPIAKVMRRVFIAFYKKYRRYLNTDALRYFVSILNLGSYLSVYLLSAAALTAETYNPFIYFRF